MQLKKFVENERQIILIKNPIVGNFDAEYQKAIIGSENADTEEKKAKLKKLLAEYDSVLKDKHICEAYLVEAETIDKVLKMPEEERKKIYLLNQNRGNDEFYIEHGNELLVEASFIPKDEDFKDEYPKLVSAVISDEYYVNMMIAWYLATALAKQWTATIPYLEERRLSEWVHRKTIQKAVESYRISPEQKIYLKSLR